MIVSTVSRSVCRAVTRSAATVSSPLTTSTRGSPLTIVFASARSFWLNVSRAASTTIRKRRNPASFGVNEKVTDCCPGCRSTGFVAARSPFTNSRTVAGWAAVEVTVPVTSIDSPRRAVDGDVSRSTRTSSVPASPVTTVSTWIPRAAASAASTWPEPVVSLPSERSTIRFWASSGNSADASRRAAPTSVAPRTGVEARRSISARSDGRRSTSASPPNATIPATSSPCRAASDSRI